MFAIITPALITGAFANRVTFKAYMLFLTAWLLFVYFPFVHMVWGGGLLAAVGRARFRRRHRGAQHRRHGARWRPCSTWASGASPTRGPHSIPLVALGTGLLWFGWYGFNAGSEFRVDSVTAVAFLNTDIAASFAAVRGWWWRGCTEKQAALPRPAHRRRRGPRHHHARGRLRLAEHGRDHRHRRRRGLLLRRRPQEQAAVGRCARRLGRPRRRRRAGHRPARHLRLHRVEPGLLGWRGRTAARQSISLRSSSWPCRSRRFGRSPSPFSCSG